MAILSNVNGKFAVDSTGAIQFSGQTGTSGYVLKSNGNAAPTWVDGSTVIGGPYLPLSGGTLTGATATASGISFTVGGTLQSGNFAIGVAPSSFGSGVPTITLQGTAANSRGGAIVFKEQDGTVTTNIYSTDGSDGYGTVINAAQGSFRVSVGALAANKLEINSSGNATFVGTVDAKGFRTTSGSTDYSLLTRNSTNTAVYIQQAGTGNIVDFRYGSQAAGQGTSAMIIKDTGEVAIGANFTGYDGQILAVNCGTADTVLYGQSSDANCFASFRDNSSNVNVEYGAIGNNHVFRKDASEQMRITSGGYVGIDRTSNLGTYTKLGIKFGTGGNAANIDESVNYSCIEMYPLRTGSTYGLFTGAMGLTSAYMQVASDSSPGRGAGSIGLNPWGGNVGIGTTSPTQKLDVAGQATHEGLVLKSGNGLYVDQITTFNITLDFVANNWVNTGLTSVSNNGLSLGAAGTYIMQIYSDDHSPGEPYWYSMYWSGIISWYNSTTNQSTAIPVPLQRTGHGDNGRTLDAQILWQTSSGTPGNNALLQLRCSSTASGTNLSLRFRRLL